MEFRWKIVHQIYIYKYVCVCAYNVERSKFEMRFSREFVASFRRRGRKNGDIFSGQSLNLMPK